MRWRIIGVGLLVAVAALVAINARATYGARISVDEPQYLLTAISLAEDFDLDIADEIADERYRDWHETDLLQQTIELNGNGQRLSPHDPLLPLLLAGPMSVGGWVGARLMMAAMAGIAAGLTLYLAERRIAVSPLTAVIVVGGLFLSPPLISYGNQIYPAMPAVIAVLVATAVVLGDTRRFWWLGCIAVVALPWLAIKYVPLAGVAAAALLYRLWGERRMLFIALGFLAAHGLWYVAFHRLVYGGWTVYATGDHFVDGEWQVVGSKINVAGRSRRLVGLLVDQGFGLAAWAPVYLGAPVALVRYVRQRSVAWPLLVGLVLAGWAVATWVALTMHGWWWPGRQVVPVLPLVALMTAAAVDGSRRWLGVVAALSTVSFGSWAWLAFESTTGRRTLIVDFVDTRNPVYRAWKTVLPDHQAFQLQDWTSTVIWTVAIVGAMVAAWIRTQPVRAVAGSVHAAEGEPSA